MKKSFKKSVYAFFYIVLCAAITVSPVCAENSHSEKSCEPGESLSEYFCEDIDNCKPDELCGKAHVKGSLFAHLKTHQQKLVELKKLYSEGECFSPNDLAQFTVFIQKQSEKNDAIWSQVADIDLCPGREALLELSKSFGALGAEQVSLEKYHEIFSKPLQRSGCDINKLPDVLTFGLTKNLVFISSVKGVLETGLNGLSEKESESFLETLTKLEKQAKDLSEEVKLGVGLTTYYDFYDLSKKTRVLNSKLAKEREKLEPHLSETVLDMAEGFSVGFSVGAASLDLFFRKFP